jgi:hypothetical protein
MIKVFFDKIKWMHKRFGLKQACDPKQAYALLSSMLYQVLCFSKSYALARPMI